MILITQSIHMCRHPAAAQVPPDPVDGAEVERESGPLLRERLQDPHHLVVQVGAVLGVREPEHGRLVDPLALVAVVGVLVATVLALVARLCSTGNNDPTNPFPILKNQKPFNDIFELHKIRWSADFKTGQPEQKEIAGALNKRSRSQWLFHADSLSDSGPCDDCPGVNGLLCDGLSGLDGLSSTKLSQTIKHLNIQFKKKSRSFASSMPTSEMLNLNKEVYQCYPPVQNYKY